MAAEVRRLQRHHDDMAGPYGDFLLAAWAAVDLSSLGRLDAPYLDAFVRDTRRKLDDAR